MPLQPLAPSPLSPDQVPRRIVLRVREVMAARSIRSAAALGRLLSASGLDISAAQLLRIIDNKSSHVNMEVVNGMLNALNCSVHELFGEVPANTKATGDTNA